MCPRSSPRRRRDKGGGEGALLGAANVLDGATGEFLRAHEGDPGDWFGLDVAPTVDRNSDGVPDYCVYGLAIDDLDREVVRKWVHSGATGQRLYSLSILREEAEGGLTPGDVNDDGLVDVGDVSQVVQSIGQTGENLPEDVSANSVVDAPDVSITLANVGQTSVTPLDGDGEAWPDLTGIVPRVCEWIHPPSGEPWCGGDWINPGEDGDGDGDEVEGGTEDPWGHGADGDGGSGAFPWGRRPGGSDTDPTCSCSWASARLEGPAFIPAWGDGWVVGAWDPLALECPTGFTIFVSEGEEFLESHSTVGGGLSLHAGADPGLVTLKAHFYCLDSGALKATRTKTLSVVRATLAAVTFDDHGVVRDHATQTVEYETPQWRDSDLNGVADDESAGDRKFPVAFTRGVAPEIMLVYVDIKPGGAAQYVKGLKGYWFPGVPLQGNIEFESQDFGTLAGFQIGFVNFAYSAPLPGFVDLLDTMRIVWTLEMEQPGPLPLGPQTVEIGVGASVNRAYVTLNDAPPDPSRRLDSFYFIGCKAAQGTSEEQAAFDAIWARFVQGRGTLNPIKNAHDKELGYYRLGHCDDAMLCTQASALVASEDGNGQCHSWADLLMRVGDAQGFATATFMMRVRPNQSALSSGCSDVRDANSDPFLFLVQQWLQTHAPLSGCSDYPLTMHYDCPPNVTTPWWPGPLPHDIENATGVAGQDSTDPASVFGLHFIVQRAGRLYDPSYGSGPFNTPSDWENASIFGFALLDTQGRLVARENHPSVPELLITSEPNP